MNFWDIFLFFIRILDTFQTNEDIWEIIFFYTARANKSKRSLHTVNCPVSNQIYFKADSKYLLRGNKISALL